MSPERVGIFSVGEWHRECPPSKGDAQWQDGYSAKESAKAWFGSQGPAVPRELEALFASHEATRGLAVATVIPELETRLDEFPGPGRHADVAVFGVAGGRRTFAAVEAKAGEDFGPLIGPHIDEAMAGTNLPDRVNWLSQAVFGRPAIVRDLDIVALRYQLLHAVAGAAIEARERGADVAVMAVHYFRNNRRPIEDSLRDFQQFVRSATKGEVPEIAPGVLVPLRLPGEGRVPKDATVLIGWATA